MYIIHNGKIITEDAIIAGFAVVVEGEIIQAIIPQEEVLDFPNAVLIDAKGDIFPLDSSISILTTLRRLLLQDQQA